jgi:transcription termination/antitermination protein NusA
MNPSEVLRIVDAIHREKNISKEIVFQGIEAALVSAAKKHYGEEEDVQIIIDRVNGTVTGTHNGAELSPNELSERIAAQTAKQVMIQKIREAERDALFNEYMEQKDQLVTGVVQRYEGGAVTVTLPNAEAILPKSEQIPGETYHPNERVRATVCEVRKQGARVRIILSRTRTQLVGRLFEQEIPEIGDSVIEVRAMAREPGYRTKVAVSSSDQRVDCVGACVGVRGNRIKNIVDELGGERIDIVRWNDDMQMLIPNALQPAEVEEVILCQMLGRAIVLVREDQLSLAIGRRGQNVRLASKLCGWDIEIMTRDELEEQLNQAVGGFAALEGMTGELAERLVGEGFLSYDDLSIIEPDDLMEMGGLNEEQAQAIIVQAEQRAEQAEQAAAAERRRQREERMMEEELGAAKAAAGESEPGGETEPASESAPVGEAPPDVVASEEHRPADSSEENPPAAPPPPEA